MSPSIPRQRRGPLPRRPLGLPPARRTTVASEGAALLVRILFGLIFIAGLKLTYDGWIAKPSAER
jgi:hypothetical protein